MKHVYLTAEKIEQAYQARGITKKEAMELEKEMKRCIRNVKASEAQKLAS